MRGIVGARGAVSAVGPIRHINACRHVWWVVRERCVARTEVESDAFPEISGKRLLAALALAVALRGARGL